MNGASYIQRGIFLLIFLFSNLHAQSFNFKNITTEDGLSSSECYKIIQDKKGYIWIATDAGLCKYNGKEFKTFTTDDGLPNNTMFEIMEDQYGWIWGGCFNGGIFYIVDDSIHNIKANEELKRNANEQKEMIRKLILDEKNVLHVGTTMTYYRINPDGDYSSLNKFPARDTNFVLFQEIGEDLLFSWITSREGIRTIGKIFCAIQDREKETRLLLNYNLKYSKYPSYYATRTPGGGILFLLANALFIYERGTVTRMNYDNNVIYAYYDRRNNLWLGLHKEGFIMYPEGNLQSNPIRGLHNHSIGGFCEDREGGMWISSLDAGIFYHPNSKVYSYQELTGQNVPAVYAGPKGIYAATSFHDLWEINSKPRKIVDINDLVQSERMQLCELNGKMYKLGGMSFTYEVNGRIEQLALANKSIYPSVAGLVLVGDSMWGISHEQLFWVKNKRITLHREVPSRGFCIFFSSKKELLVGCLDGLYEFKNDQFKKIQIHPGGQDVRISFIKEDNRGNLILSTRGHGIFIRKENNWININANHGLPSNLCNHIHCSSDGKYYISTNKGLCIYTPSGRVSVRNVDISNGLLTNEVNMCVTYNNIAYVATEKGLCYFDEDKEIYNISLPPLSIRTLKLNDKKLEVDKIYPYYMNDLSFSCDVLSYQQPKVNMIRYQLFPIDASSKYSSLAQINYDNLPPGNYNLIIWGVNNNGIEGIPKNFHFIIQKPFWNTWWFILSSFFGLVALTYLFVRERIRYIRKREEEKNLLKEKIVEYHYTALRAQMNPHFIFNVINSIQLYVLNNQPKEAYNYLSKFSKLIRKVLQNSKEKLISLFDEMETIRLYMELEQIRLEGNIEFQVKIDPSIDQENTMVPSMIIQPLLENAIWHGIVPLKGVRKGIVSLNISSYQQMLRIQIRDNGGGIDVNKPAEEKGSFGLNLIKDRLALLSDRTEMEITNLMDEQNQVRGVEVTILMPFIKK